MKGALIEFTPFSEESVLPPLILLVPAWGPLIEIDNSAECIARVDFTPVQDFGMVEQNITRFYLCWYCVFPLKIDFTAVDNLLRLFNSPKMAFGNDPDAPVINGRIIKVYVNVEDRMVFLNRIPIAVPPDGRSVFRQFENKGFIARYKIGADNSVQQIPNERMCK